MGYGIAASRTADVGVARQALAVCREVAALGLLKPDHIGSVTLYGGNVEIRPVAPGVLLARDFTCTIYRDGCICSNYGSIPILPVIHCERSSGQYLFDTLIDAGDEFGIEVDGFVDPGNRGD